MDDPVTPGARPRLLLFVLVASFAAPALARADGPSDAARRIADAGDDVLDRAARGATPDLDLAPEGAAAEEGGWSFDAIPTTDLYRRYLADPRRPRFSFVHDWRLGSDAGIDETGARHLGIMMGGRYGFVRLHPDDDPERGLQFDLELGALMQFDTTSKLDLVGWEVYYGFSLSWRPTRELAFRLAMNHDSSHIGDEYIEETGRERINYTREEFALGVSWTPVDVVRVYAEAGLAYHLGSEDDQQEPGRVQLGIEYETAGPVLWGGRWFIGVDAVFWQENGWEPSITAMTGLVWHLDRIGREYRVGLQHYDGRSLFGEFFQDRERWVGFGVWFDM